MSVIIPVSFSPSSAWAASWGTLGFLKESMDKDTMVHNDSSSAYLLLHNKPPWNLVVKSNYFIMLKDSVVRSLEKFQRGPFVSVPWSLGLHLQRPEG